MKAKTKKLMNDLLSQFHDEGAAMTVSIEGCECASGMAGEARDIARAMFTIIHDEDNELGQSLYEIVKLVATNIVGNPSPLAEDLYSSVCNSVSTSMRKTKSQTINLSVVNGEA